MTPKFLHFRAQNIIVPVIIRWTHKCITWLLPQPVIGHPLPGLYYLEAALSGTFARVVQGKSLIDPLMISIEIYPLANLLFRGWISVLMVRWPDQLEAPLVKGSIYCSISRHGRVLRSFPSLSQ
jgi:hypothetical protein